MVYVDSMRTPYRHMKMSHMLADTEEELHTMARRIGLKREWFQCPPKASTPHYDVSQTKRALAVEAGAEEVDRRGLVGVIRRLRERSHTER